MSEDMKDVARWIEAPQITDGEFLAVYRRRLMELQDHLAQEEQVSLPIRHDFSPGLYLRRIFMPAGTFVIGKTHKTEHFNIVMAGKARVMIDGHIETIEGGAVFKSKAGAKKVLYIIRDTVWMTTHPTEETDITALEQELICSRGEERNLLLKEFDRYDLGCYSDGGCRRARLHGGAGSNGGGCGSQQSQRGLVQDEYGGTSAPV
jgi:hypothetical protein